MEKTNNEKFADMLNACPDPRLFAAILLSLAKPRSENGKDPGEKREVIVGNLLAFTDQAHVNK